MSDRLTRGLGVGSVVGAIVTVAASVPSRWYGAPETDAFLFDPAPLSPLWIERTLVPAASLLAVALLAAGVAGLWYRDRTVAGRLRRWGALVAAAGLVLLEAPVVAFWATNGTAGTGILAALFVVVALLAGLLGALVLLAGMVATGVGYARTERPQVGYALAGGAAIAVVLTAAGAAADLGEALGSLPLVAALVAPFVAVGFELWSHPDPFADAADAERGTARGARPADAENSSGEPDEETADDAERP